MEQIEIKKIEDINEEMIKNIISTIGRKGFCSEADFQFSLAWELQKHVKNDKIKIRLEYLFETENTKTNKNGETITKNEHKYIDILITENDKWLPIELKFRKKAATIVDTDGYTYTLKNHGAKDVGCYNYLYDIHRIEKIKESKRDNFVRGFAIMLTNDKNYLKRPKKNYDYINFSIHIDRDLKEIFDNKGNKEVSKKIELDWINKTGNKWYEKSKHYGKKITINDYSLKWYEYPECIKQISSEKILEEKEDIEFYILINEV